MQQKSGAVVDSSSQRLLLLSHFWLGNRIYLQPCWNVCPDSTIISLFKSTCSGRHWTLPSVCMASWISILWVQAIINHICSKGEISISRYSSPGSYSASTADKVTLQLYPWEVKCWSAYCMSLENMVIELLHRLKWSSTFVDNIDKNKWSCSM